MSKSISFLLGAGFSAPMGYPIGNSMERFLYGLIDNYKRECDADPNCLEKIPYIFETMISHYNRARQCFNYEEFYEYIDFCCNDESIGGELNHYRRSGNPPINEKAFDYKKIYQWYIAQLIKDSNGKQFYGEQDTKQLSIYERFIEAIKDLLGKEYVINVHTLNHDLLFESFKYSPLIGAEISDGFEYTDSPYRGKNKETELVLPYYNGIYDKRIRLYKLHGSIDQYNYLKGGVYLEYDNHIKIGNCVDKDKELYKIENWKKTDTFRFCDFEPDFLTGIDSKRKGYLTNQLCKKLFLLFIDNLNSADCLIIIGYGAKDEGINKLIRDEFDCGNKPCFIFDLKPNDALRNFARDINVNEIIEKSVKDFEMPNF